MSDTSDDMEVMSGLVDEWLERPTRKTRDGVTIKFKDLTYNHAKNIARMLERKGLQLPDTVLERLDEKN